MRTQKPLLRRAITGFVFILCALAVYQPAAIGETRKKVAPLLTKVDSFATKNGVIYAVQNRTLSAIDPSTRAVLWKFKGRGNIAGAKVFVSDGTAYLHSSDRKGASLDAIDLETQKVLWEYKYAVDGTVQPRCYMDAGQGLLAFVGNETFLRVFRAATGDLLWSYNHYAYSFDVNSVNPVVTGNYILYGDTFSGLNVFEPATGRKIFSKLYGKIQGFNQSGNFIYWWTLTGDKNGHLCVANPSGASEQTLTINSRNPIDVAAFNNRTMIYTTFDQAYLAALDLVTFEKKWELDIAENRKYNQSSATIIMKNGLIYLAGLDDNIYAVDYKTGKIRWSEDVKGRAGEMCLDGDKIFYLDAKRNLYYITVR